MVPDRVIRESSVGGSMAKEGSMSGQNRRKTPPESQKTPPVVGFVQPLQEPGNPGRHVRGAGEVCPAEVGPFAGKRVDDAQRPAIVKAPGELQARFRGGQRLQKGRVGICAARHCGWRVSQRSREATPGPLLTLRPCHYRVRRVTEKGFYTAAPINSHRFCSVLGGIQPVFPAPVPLRGYLERSQTSSGCRSANDSFLKYNTMK